MFRTRQFRLMLSTARDYQNGVVSLERLLHVIEGITAILDDDDVYDLFEKEFSDLDQIYAHICIGDYDFETRGRSIVDRAVVDVIAKTEACLAALSKDVSEDDQ